MISDAHRDEFKGDISTILEVKDFFPIYNIKTRATGNSGPSIGLFLKNLKKDFTAMKKRT